MASGCLVLRPAVLLRTLWPVRSRSYHDPGRSAGRIPRRVLARPPVLARLPSCGDLTRLQFHVSLVWFVGKIPGGSWETATLTDAERTACGGERRGCKDVEGGPHVQAAQRHGHHRRRPVCARVPPACSAPSDPPAARAPQALRAAPPAAGLRAPRRPAAPGAPCGLPDMCTDTATAAAVAAAAVAAAGTNPRPSPTTRA